MLAGIRNECPSCSRPLQIAEVVKFLCLGERLRAFFLLALATVVVVCIVLAFDPGSEKRSTAGMGNPSNEDEVRTHLWCHVKREVSKQFDTETPPDFPSEARNEHIEKMTNDKYVVTSFVELNNCQSMQEERRRFHCELIREDTNSTRWRLENLRFGAAESLGEIR